MPFSGYHMLRYSLRLMFALTCIDGAACAFVRYISTPIVTVRFTTLALFLSATLIRSLSSLEIVDAETSLLSLSQAAPMLRMEMT